MSVSINIAGGTVHLSGNPIKVTLTASEAKTNHKLLLKVQFDEQFGGPQTDAIIPVNLVSEFDISGLVDNPVEYIFSYPDYDRIKAHTALAFLVTLTPGESWTDENGDMQEEFSENTSQIRVIKGKLSSYQLASYNDDETSFFEQFIGNGVFQVPDPIPPGSWDPEAAVDSDVFFPASGGMKFLTFMSLFQNVRDDQSLKLYLLSPWAENKEITAHFNMKIAGDEITIENRDVFTFIADGLYEFSFSVKEFYTQGFEKIEYCDFFLSLATGEPEGRPSRIAITEKRRFIVDYSYYENPYFFFYLNPLSGIDSIFLSGAFSEKLKTESETSYKPLLPGAGTQQASMITTNSSQQRVWEINTGIKSRDEMLAMRWFLSAKERWMVNPDDSQKLIPVYIEGGETLLDETDWDDKNIELKILEAHR